MDLGTAHVAAASIAIALGAVVLTRSKGDSVHVLLGRLYLISMLVVLLPVLFLYDESGRPGPFHALAVVSLVTTALGWRAGRERRRAAVGRHAAFMAWSWIGVVTAGLAQLANVAWPEHSPWPVLAVVAAATAVGAVAVPRSVSRVTQAL